jgi:hypothetical protein
MLRFRRTSLLVILVCGFASVCPTTIMHTEAAAFTAQQQTVQPVIVNVEDSGWYTQTGFHDPANTNYSVGRSGRNTYRNFFVFALDTIAGTIKRATLQITNPGGSGPPYTYTLYDVTTPSARVRDGGSGLTDIYEDLGSGVMYGSAVPAAVTTTPVHVNLNSAGIAALQAALGGSFMVGGNYPAGPNENIFGGSEYASPTAVQLILYVDQPRTPITFASDTFSRSIAQGWGSSEVGGVWNRAGTLGDFAVTEASGSMVLGAPNTTRSQTLWSVSAQDVDVTVRISSDTTAEGGSWIAYLVARRTGESTQYHGRLRFAPEGRCLVVAEQWIDGYNTILGGEREAPCGTIRFDRSYWLRMQVVGVRPTTIRLRAWQDGQPEPTTWQYTVQNNATSLQSAGAVGLRAYVSKSATNMPLHIRFDNYLARHAAAP